VAAAIEAMPPVSRAEDASGFSMPSASISARPTRPDLPTPMLSSASR
jgi:hypothetical protein